MDPSITSSKIDSMLSHEVPKTGESVESSSLELQTRVLPSSFHMSDIKRSQEPPMENQSRDANAHNFHAYCQNISNNEANLNDTDSVHRNESDVHRPSLKETAGTHESDDSIDELQGGTSNRASRFHLPSPKRKKFSPLKKYEPETLQKGENRKNGLNWKSRL